VESRKGERDPPTVTHYEKKKASAFTKEVEEVREGSLPKKQRKLGEKAGTVSERKNSVLLHYKNNTNT